MPNRPEDMPYWYPTECDPPFHDELRKVINPFLSAKAVARHEHAIRATANELVDDFIAEGEVEVEVMSQFANVLPVRIFCQAVIGMPAEDMPFLQENLQAGLLGPAEESGVAMTRVLEHIERYLEQRAQEEPRGDVVDAILGFDWPGYEFVDKAGTVAQLTSGGITTTGFVFAGALLHLAGNPEDRRRLVEDPSLMPRALDEFLRFYAPAPHHGRRTTREVEVNSTTIPADERVVLGLGLATL